MTTATDVLTTAAGHVGFAETPVNITPFGAWAGAQGLPWCHAFTSFILNQRGLSIGKIVSCPKGVVYWRDRGRLFSEPRAGDTFYLWFPSKNRYAHTGFVRSVDGDWIETIEGNSNRAGSRTGGSVVRLRRKWRGTRTVFGRPPYQSEEEEPMSPQERDDLRRAVVRMAYWGIGRLEPSGDELNLWLTQGPASFEALAAAIRDSPEGVRWATKLRTLVEQT